MESEVISQAKKLYALAQKTGLLGVESFVDVFSDVKLNKIAHGLDEDRDIFMVNSREVDAAGKIWEDGVHDRIMTDVSQIFIDYLQEKGKSFMLDYDSAVEDIVFNFKSVCSDLDISDIGEEKIEGDWYQSMKIGEDVFKYKMTDQYVPGDVLYDIGRKLFPLSKALLCTNFGDQDQYLIVSLDFAPEFTDFGFFSV